MPVRCRAINGSDKIFPHHFQPLKTDLLVQPSRSLSFYFFYWVQQQEVLRFTEKLKRSRQTAAAYHFFPCCAAATLIADLASPVH